MDISIIIVNYKSKRHTLNCIKSIKAADWSQESNPEQELQVKNTLKYEIIVVDNRSEDEIGKILSWQYPEVILIESRENLGMGKGNNLGIKRALGKYIVIMNPDTIAFSDTFKKLFAFMEEHSEVGIAGPQQLNPDYSIQSSCYRWPARLTPVYRRTPLGRFAFAQKDMAKYLMEDFDHKSRRDVDWLLGSFLFVRGDWLRQVKGFDPRYFMYFEDTDLARQFWKHGWKLVYYPEAKIIHNHMRQSAQSRWWKFFTNRMTRAHISSWLKYVWKWRGRRNTTYNS